MSGSRAGTPNPPEPLRHTGFLGGPHEGAKEDCRLCNLPDGKLVTAEELMDWHATKTMERAEAVAEAWGTHAVLRFPWAQPT